MAGVTAADILAGPPRLRAQRAINMALRPPALEAVLRAAGTRQVKADIRSAGDDGAHAALANPAELESKDWMPYGMLDPVFKTFVL